MPLLSHETSERRSFPGPFQCLLASIRISVVVVLAGTPLRANGPNIVLIMADDLGYGDLGCYGGTVPTPHLDRLAKEGMRFTDFHSNGPMCSATRTALLTGCYQNRFGRRFEGALGPSRSDENGLPLDAVTIAEVLRKSGYRTAMFGKWHLGYNTRLWPTNQGFDTFIGLGSGDGDHHTRIDRQGEADWWRGTELFEEPGYTTDLLTQHAESYIRESDAATPFFLFVSHLAIHFPWQGPADPPQRKLGIDYADDKWGILNNPHDVSSHVAAMIQSLDRSVGKLVNVLRETGLDGQTLVFFCSDNGGYLRYGRSHFNISSNGPLRGQKTEVYEGGHRVPGIAWWPGRVPPNVTTRATAMTMDLYPTFAALAGASLPQNQFIDGTDMSQLLLKAVSPASLERRPIHWRIDDESAVRVNQWKLVQRGTSIELYDLAKDVGEATNLAEEHPKRVVALQALHREWSRSVEQGYRSAPR